MKKATFTIYNPVQNEAHINSLVFHIGAPNRSTWKRIYYLKIFRFPKITSQVKTGLREVELNLSDSILEHILQFCINKATRVSTLECKQAMELKLSLLINNILVSIYMLLTINIILIVLQLQLTVNHLLDCSIYSYGFASSILVVTQG